MKEKIIGFIAYAAMYFIVLAIIWFTLSLFANSIKDYEVINPEPGVRCVVVSRVMNTSVDCWKIEDE